MNTRITEDYVSFKVAKLLKEKGFDKYPLLPCYKEDNGEFIDIPTTLDTINYCFIPAPTLQMAMKWLREEHNINIKVHCSGNRNYLVYAQSLISAFHDFCIESATCNFNTYEEACEVAIKYCLTNLI